jgi:hypothetical protein
MSCLNRAASPLAARGADGSRGHAHGSRFSDRRRLPHSLRPQAMATVQSIVTVKESKTRSMSVTVSESL